MVSTISEARLAKLHLNSEPCPNLLRGTKQPTPTHERKVDDNPTHKTGRSYQSILPFFN